MPQRPDVSAARTALSAALDAAKLSGTRRAAIESALRDLTMALEAEHVATITPAAVAESLAHTGRTIWLDGYHMALRDASAELGHVFDDAARALDAHTSELRVEGVMKAAGLAALPLWRGASAARTEALRTHHNRPIAMLVQAAREAVPPMLAAAAPELPPAPQDPTTDGETR